jgi:hypothetical protein
VVESALDAGGQRLLKDPADVAWKTTLLRIVEQLSPEDPWMRAPGERRVTQPCAIFIENVDRATRFEASRVPLEDRQTCGALRQPKPGLADGQNRAGGEPDEVVRVRKHDGLVEIVDPLDEAAFGVPPQTKVFDVEISDAQHARRVEGLRTHFRKQRDPAIERAAKEDEGAPPHAAMLRDQIRPNDRALATEPFLIPPGRFVDAHDRSLGDA